MTSPKFRVAICGGGIGGLSLAVAIRKFARQDIQIDIYEAKDKFAEIGAGMSVWKRTWSVFRQLELVGDFEKIAIKPPVDEPSPGFAFKRADQEAPSDLFYQLIQPYGSITLHRAEVLKVLTDNLPNDCQTHFQKRLTSYEQTGEEIALSFSDGSVAHTDLLVGADGLKSATRASMYRAFVEKPPNHEIELDYMDFIEPKWCGIHAYRTVFDAEKLRKLSPNHHVLTMPVIFCGRNQHVVSYPISRGRLINLVGLVDFPQKEGERLEGPMMSPCPIDEMTKYFDGWDPEVKQLMSCVESASRWSVCTVRSLPHFSSGHVVLLGDAAHAMSPDLGAGASQAIEDAFILGRILTHESVNLQTLDQSLAIYEAIRKPIATKFFELSRMLGRCYNFNPVHGSELDGGIDFSTADGLQRLSEVIYESWSSHWTGLPAEDWGRAEIMLNGMTTESP